VASARCVHRLRGDVASVPVRPAPRVGRGAWLMKWAAP